MSTPSWCHYWRVHPPICGHNEISTLLLLSWCTLHKQPTRGGFRSELVLLVYSTTGTFNLILFTSFVFQNITYACRDKHKIEMGFCCCFCPSPAELLFFVSSTPSRRQTKLSLICQQLLICSLTGWRGTRWPCVCIANRCRVHLIAHMCFSIAIFGRLKERQQKGEEVMQCEESSHLWLVLSVIRRKGKWNGPSAVSTFHAFVPVCCFQCQHKRGKATTLQDVWRAKWLSVMRNILLYIKSHE